MQMDYVLEIRRIIFPFSMQPIGLSTENMRKSTHAHKSTLMQETNM